MAALTPHVGAFFRWRPNLPPGGLRGDGGQRGRRRANRKPVPDDLLQFARDLDPQLADKFVGMYVNERTLDYGPDGREAVSRLLSMGHKAGIIPYETKVEFVA